MPGPFPLLRRLLGTAPVDAITYYEQQKLALREQFDAIMATPIQHRSTGVAFVTFSNVRSAKRYLENWSRLVYSRLDYINDLGTSKPLPQPPLILPKTPPVDAATPLLHDKRSARPRSKHTSRRYGSLLLSELSSDASEMEDIPLDDVISPSQQQQQQQQCEESLYARRMKLAALHQTLNVRAHCLECNALVMRFNSSCRGHRSASGSYPKHHRSTTFNGSSLVSASLAQWSCQCS